MEFAALPGANSLPQSASAPVDDAAGFTLLVFPHDIELEADAVVLELYFPTSM
jgi:hypothetical protein